MKKIIILLMITLVFVVGCSSDTEELNQENDETINIIVSIQPQKTFVEKVVGDLAKVSVVIPQGYSPANYQPSPKEMQDISNGDVYFSIGVESEKAFILPKLKDLNEEIILIDLQNKVMENHEPLFIGEEHKDYDDHDHEEGEVDPHIWLSPKRVVTIIEAIRDYMIEIDSINEDIYNKNANEYIKQLQELDEELDNTFIQLKTKAFIIYHPAFSYFADDYNLDMVTIEEDGKEATAVRIQNVVDFAKENNIKVVFYQEEFDSNQAKIIAQEIGGEVVEVAPLSGNYIQNMNEIKNKFKKVLE